jgi:hypothetical protein
MKLNGKQPWTALDVLDLKAALQQGHSVSEMATYMSRDQEEILAKMHELGLVPINFLEFRSR